MNQRVKELRTTLGLTMEEFGRRIGLGKAAISKIERNLSKLTDQTIRLICYEFGVNEEWLRGGTGDIFVRQANDRISALAKKYNLSPWAYIAIEKFAGMEEDKQRVLLNYYIDVAAAITAEELGLTPGEMVAEYRSRLKLEE